MLDSSKAIRSGFAIVPEIFMFFPKSLETDKSYNAFFITQTWVSVR